MTEQQKPSQRGLLLSRACKSCRVEEETEHLPRQGFSVPINTGDLQASSPHGFVISLGTHRAEQGGRRGAAARRITAGEATRRIYDAVDSSSVRCWRRRTGEGNSSPLLIN